MLVMEKALTELITSYQESNSSFVDEFQNQPSALEFMRYVAINRPFVVRKCISHWPAIKRWNIEYLKAASEGSSKISVVVTPEG